MHKRWEAGAVGGESEILVNIQEVIWTGATQLGVNGFRLPRFADLCEMTVAVFCLCGSLSSDSQLINRSVISVGR